MKNRTLLLLVITALILTALTKVWSPLANFSPIGAIALMGGAFMGRRAWAFILPILAIFIGDIMISGQSPIYSEYLFSSGFLFVYLSFGLIVLIGIMLRKRLSVTSVIGGSLLAAVLFFIVSNFGSWIFLPEYPKTISGLVTCYIEGIPFFRSTLLSQLLYSLVLYLVWSWSLNRKLAFSRIPE